MSLQIIAKESTTFECIPKKKRPSLPKVRSGCRTCRQRRIKCDESRPGCHKCVKYGSQCGGYSQDTENQARRVLLLLPKHMSTPSTRLPYSPGRCPSESEQDWRYYEYYREDTALSVAGSYDPQLWNRIVLQAAEQEPNLRHMLRALAALDLATATTKGLISWNFAGFPDGPHEHYQYALKQYGKGLKEIRKQVAEGKPDLKTTLIAAHLSIAFETFHGNFEPALAQVYNVARLLDDSGCTENGYMKGTSSSNSFLGIQDDLAQMLYAFSFISMTFTPDIIPVQVHMKRKNDHEEALAQMPRMFDSVREAIFYIRIIARRCIHFQAASWMFDKSQTGPPNPGAHLALMDRVSNTVTPEAFQEQKKHLDNLDKWKQAATPLVQHSQTPAGRRDRVIVALMQLHYVANYISAASALTTDEMFYDSLTPQFECIIQLSRETYDLLPAAKYTLALRAIAFLDMTARKCRDPILRREAIQLLLAQPRREVFWDSAVTAQICLWVVSLEEEDIVDGHVPRQNRVRNTAMKMDMKEKRIHVWCMQPRKGGNAEEWVRRETTLGAW